MKIRNSINISTPKVGIRLGVCGLILSHSHSHFFECKCDSWVAFLIRTFPYLCFSCVPNVRVVTNIVAHVKGKEPNVQKLVLNEIFAWWQDLKICALYVERNFTCYQVLELWQEVVNFKNEVDKQKLYTWFKYVSKKY